MNANNLSPIEREVRTAFLLEAAYNEMTDEGYQEAMNSLTIPESLASHIAGITTAQHWAWSDFARNAGEPDTIRAVVRLAMEEMASVRLMSG